jgi:hypothetical protein
MPLVDIALRMYLFSWHRRSGDRKLNTVASFEHLVTACPFCLLNLREAAELGLQVAVKDITEVLANISIARKETARFYAFGSHLSCCTT